MNETNRDKLLTVSAVRVKASLFPLSQFTNTKNDSCRLVEPSLVLLKTTLRDQDEANTTCDGASPRPRPGRGFGWSGDQHH